MVTTNVYRFGFEWTVTIIVKTNSLKDVSNNITNVYFLSKWRKKIYTSQQNGITWPILEGILQLILNSQVKDGTKTRICSFVNWKMEISTIIDVLKVSTEFMWKSIVSKEVKDQRTLKNITYNLKWCIKRCRYLY